MPSASKTSKQRLCRREDSRIFTKVVISYFRKSPPQKGLDVPPEAEACRSGMAIAIDQGECSRVTGSQLHRKPDSRIVRFKARVGRSLLKHLFQKRGLTGSAPFNGKPLDGSGIVRNTHVTRVGPSLDRSIRPPPPEN